MDFGLFNLVNRRDAAQSVPAMLHEVADYVRCAEQAGFGTAWFTEHHFSNYALTPSPLLLAAHCAATTRTIRLGTAVVLVNLYDPARLVAELAFVDCLSDGRLTLGVGTGYQAYEYARFGVTLAESRDKADEVLEIIERAYATGRMHHRGAYFDIPDTELSLPFVQRPGPPIWFAGNSPPSLARAATNDYTLFATGFGRGADMLADVRAGAEAAWQAAGRDPASLRFAILRHCHVTDSAAEALEFAENSRFQVRLSAYLRRGQTVIPDGLLPEAPFDGEMSPDELLRDNPIGDPETVAEKLAREIRATNPVHIALFMQMGRIGPDRVRRSIARFGAEVIPLLERELGPLGAIGPAATAGAAA